MACGVFFWNAERHPPSVVHGDDLRFRVLEIYICGIPTLMESWFQSNVRASMGPEVNDDKEIIILGRIMRWSD